MTSMLNQRTRADHATASSGRPAAARLDGITHRARSRGSGIAFIASSVVASTIAPAR